MSLLFRLAEPFKRLWHRLRIVLMAFDKALVWFATPFGVQIKEPSSAISALLGIYTFIYLIALLPIPVLPLIALAVGYLGVLAVGRAWVVNEKQRSAIAKKQQEGHPDDLPDLRWTALVSALQLVILFPFIFQQAQLHFGLYKVPEGTNFGTWVLFTLDSYNKAFLGLFQVYGVQAPNIGYESAWGRHLVMGSRLTFDYLLLQGIVRIFAIRETIRDAIQALKIEGKLSALYNVPYDPTAARLGNRAVTPLIHALKDQNWVVRASAAKVLGQLGDTRAAEPLVLLLHDPVYDVYSAAVGSLGKLKASYSVPPLIQILEESDALRREDAVFALGAIGDVRAVEPLIRVLRGSTKNSKFAAAIALRNLQDTRAIQPLVEALGDANLEVRGQAAVALAKVDAPGAFDLIVPLLSGDPDFLRPYAVEALGESRDERAFQMLIQLAKELFQNNLSK